MKKSQISVTSIPWNLLIELMLISINLMNINIIYIISKKIIIETWKISSIYVDHRTIYIDHTIPLILITILIQQTYHITEDKLNIYKHIQQNLSNTKKTPLSIYFVPRNNSHTRKLTQHIPPTHTHTNPYTHEKNAAAEKLVWLFRVFHSSPRRRGWVGAESNLLLAFYSFLRKTGTCPVHVYTPVYACRNMFVCRCACEYVRVCTPGSCGGGFLR